MTWAAGVLGAAPGAARAVVVGRVVVGLVEEASEVRGAERAVDGSALGRVVVRGRFAAAVVEGAIVDLRSDAAAFPGEDLVAAVADSVVLRGAGFLFSSPDVMDDRSGSASEAVDLEATPGRLATVPGAGRVGGLFKLDPAAPVRMVELARGRDAVVEALGAAVEDAGGRRAPTGAVLPAAGRRGGTCSPLGGAEAVDDAILRRAVEEGVGGAGGLLGWGASAGAAVGSLASAMLPVRM